MPETITYAAMAGVMTRFTGGGWMRRGPRRSPPPASALVPGRRRVTKLAGSEILGPDGHLLPVLPLEEHQLVGYLEAILIYLVVSEERPRLELQKLLADPVGVEAAGAPDALGVELAAGISGRRVVHRVAAELLLVRLEELLLARIRKPWLPLGGAVDVLGVLLQKIGELGKIAPHRHAVHLGIDVQLPHLPGQGHGIVEVGRRRQDVRVDRLQLRQQCGEVLVALGVGLLEHHLQALLLRLLGGA